LLKVKVTLCTSEQICLNLYDIATRALNNVQKTLYMY